MTAQIGEILYYEGREHRMCAEPLNDFFLFGGAKPDFSVGCTALWRGYVGTWEICEGRLYLIGIDGAFFQDGTKVTLEVLFPGYSNRVFAHWYSGTLRVPDGKLLAYVHMGYGSVYERDILIHIENGVVKATETRNNGESADPDAPEGYSPGLMTVLGTRAGSKDDK